MMKKTLILSLSLMLIVSMTAMAGDTSERVLTPVAKCATAIDQLLIDTAHVYVNPAIKVVGVELEDSGVVFAGRISITSTGGLKDRIGCHVAHVSLECMKDVKIDMSELDEGLEELAEELKELEKELENLDITLEGIENAEDLQKLGELSKLSNLSKLSKLSKLAELADLAGEGVITEIDDSGKKVIVIKTGNDWALKSKERLDKMDEHISAFKLELIETIIGFTSKFHALKGKEIITVAFAVAEPEFADKYGCTQLVVSVTMKELRKHATMDPRDPAVVAAFNFNI